MKFEFGDYVIYDPGYKDPELGRVIEQVYDDVFICFDAGCTSKCTPLKYVRPATNDEVARNEIHFGFHRFDDHCPEFNPDICYFNCFKVNIP